MASITIRNFDDSVKEKLRLRAAKNQRSMEAEARAMLTEGLAESNHGKRVLGDLRDEFVKITGGGVDLDSYLPERNLERDPPDFHE